MAKGRLSLTVDSELVELAKNSNLNLSAEFEEWVRIRLQQNIAKDIEHTDYPLEKAKLIQQISLLESREALSQRQGLKDKEEKMILDNFISNIKEFDILPLNDNDLGLRVRGLIFLYKQKINKKITTEEATELIKKGLENAD